MKKYITLLLVTIFFSCSDADENIRTMYDITYTVTATNGATINKVQYRDSNGDLIEINNASSPWSINLTVRAGLGLEAAAFGDVPYQGKLAISATWTPKGGLAQSETEELPNNSPNSVLNNAKVEISGRTLPD